ncbi:MAG: molybdopterin molybdotransferase MoeA [Thermodesulfobacteriota bacterium]|nr:molybdopterin molybdotransferase MoeA [Thermodesulfobacteriota bacterium]
MLTLAEAQKLILQNVTPTPSESVPLIKGLNRVASRPIRAGLAVPHFDQSGMDGFAVRSRDLAGSRQAGPVQLTINAEISAGQMDIPVLGKNEAVRIMTGAHLPISGDQVIPFEQCHEQNQTIFVNQGSRPGLHIRKAGCDLRKNRIIFKKGEKISPSHLHLLASSGVEKIQVYRKPVVAIICTGSELVTDSPAPGQTIGSNRILLNCLVKKAGGSPRDMEPVADQAAAIGEAVRGALDKDTRMIITTGGMGPGKFDLVSQCLQDAGVEFLYQRLNIRPGKSTAFGMKDNTLFFALPGPPPAVQTLFCELVRPALLKLQGDHSPGPHPLRIRLKQKIVSKKKGFLSLKSAMLTLKSGHLSVQSVSRGEAANSVILIPPHRRHLNKGEMVTVHPFYGIMS